MWSRKTMGVLGRLFRVATCVTVASILVGCSATNGRMMNRWGMHQYKKGNYAAARDQFARAVADDPYHPDYRHNLAAAHQKMGDPATAERILRHNLSIDPMHQPTYHALAQNLMQQQRTAEAQDLLAEWTATQPYVPQSHIEMAWLQKELNNPAGAEAALRQALQVEPNNPVALAHLGEVYHKTGRSDVAAAYYKRSLTSRWDQPEVKSRLTTVSNRREGRRSAMAMNSEADLIPLQATNVQYMDQSMLATGTTSYPAMVASEPSTNPTELSRREIRKSRRGGNEQLAVYPLPTYGDEASVWGSSTVAAIHPETQISSMPIQSGFDATAVNNTISIPSDSSFQPPIVTQSPSPSESDIMPQSPTTVTAQMAPVPASSISSGPPLVPQADPAHATDNVAGLPVVDPY